MRYNHAFSFAFSLVNDSKEGFATGADLKDAIYRRLKDIDDAEMVEACGVPFNTFEGE
jgi:hypothetical protein